MEFMRIITCHIFLFQEKVYSLGGNCAKLNQICRGIRGERSDMKFVCRTAMRRQCRYHTQKIGSSNASHLVIAQHNVSNWKCKLELKINSKEIKFTTSFSTALFIDLLQVSLYFFCLKRRIFGRMTVFLDEIPKTGVLRR